MKDREQKLQGEETFEANEISGQIFNDQEEMFGLSSEMFNQEVEGDLYLGDNLESSFFHSFVANSKTPKAPIYTTTNFSSSDAVIQNVLENQANTEEQEKMHELDTMTNIQSNETHSELFVHTSSPQTPSVNTSYKNKENDNLFSLLANIRQSSKKPKPKQFYFSESAEKYSTATKKFYVDNGDVKTRVYSRSQKFQSGLYYIDESGEKIKIEDPEVLKTHKKTGGEHGPHVKHIVTINNQRTEVYSYAQIRKLKDTRKREIEYAQDETAPGMPSKKMRFISNELFTPIESTTTQESTGDFEQPIESPVPFYQPNH